MRELSAHEMNAVAGGFSIGSCSVGASYSSSRDGHGGSSTLNECACQLRFKRP